MKFLGAHVSAAGGVQNVIVRAEEIGANATALFTKNQRQWKAKPLEKNEIELFKSEVKRSAIAPEMILPHASYLINVGNPDKTNLIKSKNALLDELIRCEILGITLLNFHPGSHLNQISEEACLSRIAESLNEVLDKTEAAIAVLENTAGQGSNVGYSVDHLAMIIDQIDHKGRIGICIDTCHTFAAGYNLSEKREFERFWQEIEEKIGWFHLKGLHLNDSKKECGSRVDRHECLGDGKIGLEPFKWIMNDKRFDSIPLILETPNPDGWKDEIELLRSFVE